MDLCSSTSSLAVSPRKGPFLQRIDMPPPFVDRELGRFFPLLSSVSFHCFKLIYALSFIGKNYIFTLIAYAALMRWIAKAKTARIFIFTTAEFFYQLGSNLLTLCFIRAEPIKTITAQRREVLYFSLSDGGK